MKCWIPSYRVTLIRDWENVFVMTGFLYTSGYCSTNFTVTGAKDIVRFPGVIVLRGFLKSEFYCIRREKHKIRKRFDTQCDIRLTFVLMSFWHRGYHLCLMSLNVIRKKRSSTLLTISAVAILKPISFQRLSCCLRYRFYDWTKSPAPGHLHATKTITVTLRNANSCHVGYL